MYNVLDKLRTGAEISEKEKAIHDHGLVSVLKSLHDDLDAAVFEAYGWPATLTDEETLERLVALNKERAEEEKRGLVRWLRPDYQAPKGQAMALPGTEEAADDTDAPASAIVAKVIPWPKKLSEQISAVRDLCTKGEEWSSADVAKSFKGAKAEDVAELLEGLAALGVLVAFDLPEGPRWRAARLGR